MEQKATAASQNTNRPRKRPATDGEVEEKHLWDHLSDSEEEDELMPAPPPASVSPARVEEALTSYWNSPRIPQLDDPFEYWRNHKSEHPEVFQLAKESFSCPPGSVESERLFSTAGNVISERRTRLNPENAEDQIFLAKNLVHYKFDY